MSTRFKDRTEAGQLLANALQAYANRVDVLVLGLPRGGVPIAYEVAKALHVPLDVCLVRKLGVPDQPELAMGAIAPGGVIVLNDALVKNLGVSQSALNQVIAKEQQELERREQAYRGQSDSDARSTYDLRGRTVILVDDGIATGATLDAAIATLRPQQPSAIVIAVPVAPPATLKRFESEVAEVVALSAPSQFSSLGLWYHDFAQTSDETVRQLLKQSAENRRAFIATLVAEQRR